MLKPLPTVPPGLPLTTLPRHTALGSAEIREPDLRRLDRMELRQRVDHREANPGPHGNRPVA